MRAEEARDRIRRLLSRGCGESHVMEAALLLGTDEYPGLNPQPYLDQIDDLAHLVEERNGESEEPVHRVASIRRVLFEDAGFRGDRENYYDPRNSYLNEVLDRRLGIPISLSILVIAVARRLDWPVSGVNFPAHFLVRYGEREPLAVDAFHGGLILGEEELRERFESSTSGAAPPMEQLLQASSSHAILARLLNNLKKIYIERQDFPRAAATAEKMVLVEPDRALHHRDLGYLYALLKQTEPAVSELQRYLRMRPDAPDRDTVLNCIQTVSESGIRWDA